MLFLRAAIATAVFLVWLAPAGRAQIGAGPPRSVPLPGPPGFYVLVPRGGGYVYVPLSPSGWPLAPDAGPGTPAPMPPGAPAGTGSLAVEVDPPGTRVIIDGREVGPAASLGGAGHVATVPAGLHRLELVFPGFRPLALQVEIGAGRLHVLRWRLDPDPATSAEETPGDGYQVIRPRAGGPEPPPAGTGYFVVPRP
jgi:hypothetical protein